MSTKLVKGNKLIDTRKKEIKDLLSRYKSVVIDLGTGDGRFVYKNALENLDVLYIGIDPSQKQMEIYSKKAVRNKVENALFVLGSVEIIPVELEKVADEVNINLPWGSLLGNIINVTPKSIKNISRLLKKNGILKILIGYSRQTEPTEFRRLGLEKIDTDYINNKIKPGFLEFGLKLKRVRLLDKKNLKNIETTWGKKLSFGKDRSVYTLEFLKTTN